MPGTADKVKFGVKNVHYALLTDEGTPSYDTPVAIPGAVSLSLEASGESTPFYADNMQYYVTVSNSGYETELEVAIFPDSFLMDVLGYTQSTTDKVLTENSNTQPKPFALLFEEAGDQIAGDVGKLHQIGNGLRPEPHATALRRCAQFVSNGVGCQALIAQRQPSHAELARLRHKLGTARAARKRDHFQLVRMAANNIQRLRANGPRRPQNRNTTTLIRHKGYNLRKPEERRISRKPRTGSHTGPAVRRGPA